MDFAMNPVMKAFLAGSLSGTCSTLLFQPLDLVKTRIQQTQQGPRASLVRVISNVVSQDSVRGLWRGLVPSLVRTVPGVGLYFSSMHHMKTILCDPGQRPTALQSAMIGCSARALAASLMIPFTVIKTRFESRAYNYSSTTHALTSILRTEGLRGVTKGLGPTLVRDVPFSGLYLMFYEQLKTLVPEEVTRTQSSAAVHFSCGLMAGLLASLVTQPADVIKTRLQLSSGSGLRLTGAVLEIYRDRGLGGFTTGLVPRSLRRTLMAALAWTVYERMIRSIGLK